MIKTKQVIGTGLLALVWMFAALAIAPVLAQTATEVVLHNFARRTGDYPYAGVIRDPAGNLYGTSYQGGTANAGMVYKLDTTGHETVLYSFTGGANGGPVAGVIRDSAGNLYGTTYGGGAANAGTVYKLDSAGNYTVLYSFAGGADGANPSAGVIRTSQGDLYGTTVNGGNHGGVMFTLKPQ